MAEHPPPSLQALPIELILEIIRLLPVADQRSLSLTSQVTRELTLPFIFGHLKYTTKRINKIRDIHQARNGIKEVIRKLDLHFRMDSRRVLRFLFPRIICQFLESLPNLRSFEFSQFSHHIRPADISRLIASLRHAPLLEFMLDTGFNVVLKGPPAIGLPGLEKLSIIWTVDDDQPGRAHSHLYEFIRPSFTTLVHLRIDDLPTMHPVTDFDLQLLKPAGDSLRSFEYTFASLNESILDTIPIIFPHLTRLKIAWCPHVERSVLWKDAHIDALARNLNLMDLTLNSDFETQDDDGFEFKYDYGWIVRSYARRLETTQKVAVACTKLQRCCWIQIDEVTWDLTRLQHQFIIEERMLDGKRARLVRGVKQYWMDRENDCGDGTILEDLPGDIIDQPVV